MRRRSFLAAAVAATAGACRFPYGFSGGRLGGDDTPVKTVAVVPFDNETMSPELPRELSEALREGLEKSLGLRPDSEEKADAIVRGKLVKYDLDIPVAVAAGRTQAATARRRLTVGLDIEIVHQASGKVLWQKTGMSADGEYAERAEAAGRKQAIDRIVSDVIEGAQSQW